ncbi:TonB-dependent receptor [Sphingobium sp.]|uniref:TonB-dependent receptor n=1 Tax=Sphingobium sp. TaxID=1912891 RepID=UPI0028BE00D3|nr:TonB-dependent receptor [Sphingobium sp.]
MKREDVRTSLVALTSAGVTAIALASAGVQAQTALPKVAETPALDQQAEAARQSAGDIVVTASRAGVSGAQAPTPTTVLGAAALEQRQVTNVAQILNEVPAFRATTSPAANAIRTQTPGASTADLRGLGAARTLVLVNGARIPPLAPASNGTGTIPTAPDLNTVPTLLIQRVEVVTGGASAQWGSDAVAGVVNILFKNQFEGLELRGQTSISSRGDAGNYRFGVLAGTGFGEGGHIVFGMDYVKNDQVGDVYTRGWGRNEYGRVANAAFATNGQPASIIATGVHAATSPGGLITGPATFALRNYEFTSATTVSRFDTGGIRNATLQIGGQGQSLARGVSLAPGVERFNPYLRAEYVFSDALTIFAEASYSVTNSDLATLPPRDAAISISRENPFIPAPVLAALGALPGFTMSRVDYDLGNALVHVENRTPSVRAGASGALGGGWKWDAVVGWGENRYRNEVSNNRNLRKFAFATDAVSSGGQVVCRATLPGAGFNPAAEGCVPINLFGNGTPSAAAIAYVTDPSWIAARYKQKIAALNISGEPFSTWAGPVAVALGVEYRDERQRVTADAVAAAGGFETSNAIPFAGKFNVKEGYLEAVVPLARDAPLLQSLDVNGAVRVADYSTVGTQTTWKVGATWEPFDGVRFRASRSRDIRAPAIFELYSNGAVTNLPVIVNGVSASVPQNSTIGNAALDPERADTWTVGVVLQPRGIPGLSLSVDYFNINLKDAITTVAGATAGPLCSLGQSYFCSLFTFSGTTPTSFRSNYINAAAIHTKGIDIAGSYRLPLDQLNDGWGGSLTFSFSGTYTPHFYSNLGNGSSTIDYAGDNSNVGVAKFRSNSSVTYERGGFSLTGQVTTLSAGKIDKTAGLSSSTSINNNRVPAVAYVNLQASQDIGERFRIFAGINNLLDKAPPALPSATLFTLTNGAYYDTIGRTFTIGANVKF